MYTKINLHHLWLVDIPNSTTHEEKCHLLLVLLVLKNFGVSYVSNGLMGPSRVL